MKAFRYFTLLINIIGLVMLAVIFLTILVLGVESLWQLANQPSYAGDNWLWFLVWTGVWLFLKLLTYLPRLDKWLLEKRKKSEIKSKGTALN